uniref:Acetylcholine-binding protein 3 n=1 Tax=Pardosa pseudoannulata TaxID=330961 RepID=A0A1Y0F4G1_9ARAC|nr:acetylcholine-binding protein 3 [Pardosa pseudoannulata]
MGFFSILYLIAISAIGLSSLVNGDVFKSERELRRDIFRDYDNQARPVKRASTPVPAKLALSFLGLTDMNEKDQIIVLESLMALYWTDEYLHWDPSEYDNITELHVSPSSIWRPEVALYNAIGDSSYFPIVQTDAIIYSNGTVLWVPPFTLKSRCPTSFGNSVPFTNKYVECTINMGSWTNSRKRLDLRLLTNEVDLTDFQDYNRNWKLVKVDSSWESRLYPCCADEYSLLTFNVTLKRRHYGNDD